MDGKTISKPALYESGLGISILPELILKRIPYKVMAKEFVVPVYRDIGFAVRDSRTVPYAVKNLRNISALSEFAIAFSENVWYTVVNEKFNEKRG